MLELAKSTALERNMIYFEGNAFWPCLLNVLQTTASVLYYTVLNALFIMFYTFCSWSSIFCKERRVNICLPQNLVNQLLIVSLHYFLDFVLAIKFCFKLLSFIYFFLYFINLQLIFNKLTSFPIRNLFIK